MMKFPGRARESRDLTPDSTGFHGDALWSIIAVAKLEPLILSCFVFSNFPSKPWKNPRKSDQWSILLITEIMTLSSGEVEPPVSGNTKNQADKELTVTVCYRYIKLTSKTLRPQTPAGFSENTLPLDPHWPDRGGIDSRRHDWQQCPRPPWLRSTIVWMWPETSSHQALQALFSNTQAQLSICRYREIH